MIKNRRIPNRVWCKVEPVGVVFTITVGIGVSTIPRAVVITIGSWFHAIGENAGSIFDNGRVSLPFRISTGQRSIKVVGIGVVLVDQ